MSVLWRDISLSDRLGSRRLIDPSEYARMRVKQNVIAQESECGYQRQTGRTFRMMLRVMENANRGKRSLIVVHSKSQSRMLHELAKDWIDQLAIQASGAKEYNSGYHIIGKVASSGPLISIMTADLGAFGGASYDFTVVDNAITDMFYMGYKSPPQGLIDMMLKLQSVRNSDAAQEDELISSDGTPWQSGDLFMMSGANVVGTLLSVDRVGGIPIGLKVLYDQNMLHFPWEALAVFHKVSSIN